jgi:Protein of unknown function (DUF2934)
MPSPAKSSAAPAKKGAITPAETKSVAPARTAAAKPTQAERAKMIAEAAYYLAEKRGFKGGNELADWATAEKQVDAIIAKRG